MARPAAAARDLARQLAMACALAGLLLAACPPASAQAALSALSIDKVEGLEPVGPGRNATVTATLVRTCTAAWAVIEAQDVGVLYEAPAALTVQAPESARFERQVCATQAQQAIRVEFSLAANEQATEDALVELVLKFRAKAGGPLAPHQETEGSFVVPIDMPEPPAEPAAPPPEPKELGAIFGIGAVAAAIAAVAAGRRVRGR